MEKMRKSRRDEARRNKKIMSTFSTKQNTSTSSTETSKIYICFSFFFLTLTIRAEKHHFPDRCATVFHWRHAPAIVVYCIHTHTHTYTLKCVLTAHAATKWSLLAVWCRGLGFCCFFLKIAKSRTLLACWWYFTTGQFMERSTTLVLVPWRSDEAFGVESTRTQKMFVRAS